MEKADKRQETKSTPDNAKEKGKKQLIKDTKSTPDKAKGKQRNKQTKPQPPTSISLNPCSLSAVPSIVYNFIPLLYILAFIIAITCL